MIALRHVSKFFGPSSAVEDFSLRIEAGAFFVFVGPSGCGKSTVLRMINAMIEADRGTIEIRGKDISALDKVELRRGIGYVIQSGGLFPHWSIAENIEAVPRLLGWNRGKIDARVEEIVGLLQIDRSLLARYPRQLSGGQQQRIGVARALAADPDIILMDEPFAALDPVSRANLQDELRRLHAQSDKTIVFVTHDMDEALRLATDVLVMNKGRVVQTGAPAQILLHPANDFVRAFLGREALGFRLLDFVKVGERAAPGSGSLGATIKASASLKDALNLMLERHHARLHVVDDNGASLGEIDIADIVAGHHAN
ncbi:MAG: ABC transporter ATP-binding protein [Methylocella sp.]